ncbi:hypothetical protein IMG5_015760 [Ichthyophthirius multifiliis]|uniref:Calpain catalytic domain-containing protein n=1 Tax=Ichthyophthirius multifiliis TaxID=5932 RepID=G0QKC0_ICHMU|nr:hypothetical protein IMG5_015760 [Ichthyophthirius multifiliis]EGR34337.1 hypothetical protein IMG5_015760 [Ichthyophthirius multifiliis]|eukprot:XP_004039641.1 hypothetical protein IMG5_015760 [Ichthyophthirius multifiliis]
MQNNISVQNSAHKNQLCEKTGKEQRYPYIISDNQKKYQGEVLNGKKDGYGIEEDNQKKTVYEGEFKEDMYHGQGILYQENNCCFFKGMFENNEKKAGIEILPNGDQYEGEYQNKKYHGKGFLHNSSMSYRYEGDFQNGQRHGFGKEFYKNQSYYVGEFLNNQKHGKGRLQYKDGSYYQGDFVNGMQCGFGIHVTNNREQLKILKFQEYSEYYNQNLILEKEDVEEEDKPEYFYEGEFVQGFKHGIGRFYDDTCSYFYCKWRFNKKVGKILYYNSTEHSYSLFFYKDDLQDIDHFISPFDNPKQLENIVFEIKQMPGFPPYYIDAYKSLIDECGIKGKRLEDIDFAQNQEYLYENQILVRISQHPKLKEMNDLFISEKIEIGQIIFNNLSDYQLVGILDCLCLYPHLYFKVFHSKFDLENIGFFSIKMYIEGEWKEIILDEFLPCLNNEDKSLVFSSSEQFDIGWMLLQKAFAKIFGSYKYFKEMNKKFVQSEEGNFVILKCLQEQYVGISNSYKDLFVKEVEDALKKYQGVQFVFVVSLEQFVVLFGDIYILVGINTNLQNSIDIYDEIPDIQNNDYKYYIQFAINLPTRVFLNVEQNILKEQNNDFVSQIYPCRIVLGQLKENMAKNKRDFLARKFVDKTKDEILVNCHTKQQGSKIQSNNQQQKEQQSDKKKKKLVQYKYIFGKGQIKNKNTFKTIKLDAGEYRLLIQLEGPDSRDLKGKKLLLKMNVNIFSDSLIQLTRIQEPDNFQYQIYYDCILQAENDSKQKDSNQCPFQKTDLSERDNGDQEITISQFYLKKEGTYLQLLSNKSNDRSWRQKIYFRNENMKIVDQQDDNKVFKYYIYIYIFNIQKKKYLKVDLHLLPQNENLIIVQQIKALPYTLEGGEGICIIEKIGNQQNVQKNRDENEDINLNK